jgi:outer membrane protein assembly factor BamA
MECRRRRRGPAGNARAAANAGAVPRSGHTRDSGIDPSRGVYAGLEYQAFFKSFLGGTSSWEQLNIEARTYLRLKSRAASAASTWPTASSSTAGQSSGIAF